MSIHTENRRIESLGPRKAGLVLMPLRDRLPSVASALAALLAVIVPVALLLVLLLASAAIAWEMIEWWKAAAEMVPSAGADWMDWLPAR